MSRPDMKTHITPKQAAVLFIPFMILILLASCNRTPVAAEEAATENAHGPEVELTREQAKAIALSTGPLEHRDLRSTLKVNGRLTLPPQNEAQVSALIGGIVSRIPVREGEAVGQGQVLLEVASTEFLQLQQDYLEASADLDLKRANMERQRALRTENINAQRTFQEAEAALRSAEARQKGMAEKLGLLGTDARQLTPGTMRTSFFVKAPIAGSLHHISVTMGQYIEPNKPLFSITDNKALHIDLTVFEQDISKVHVGQKVTFSIAKDPHGTHEAEIFGVNKAFEPGQQAILVHARMSNVQDQLLPGMFIDARIQTSSDSALCLPERAIVGNGDDHYIYVEHEPNTFRQVQVAIGATDQGYTEIKPLDLLAPDAKVVMNGAYYLLSQMTKGSGEHAH